MENHPTSTSGSGRCSAYYTSLASEEDAVSDALGHIRAREDRGEITTSEAASERIQLLEQHLERVRQLRIRHQGGAS